MVRYLLIIALAVVPFARPCAGAYSDDELRALEVLTAVLVNTDRLKHDLPMLEYSFELADVARSHSLDMAKRGFFSHESPTTGSPADRVHKARLPAMTSAENLAMNKDIDTAQKALMNSPGHRKNILNPEFTHVGVGIAVNAEGSILVTQNFMTRVEEMDPETAPDTIAMMVNALREQRELAPLVVSPTLSRAARRHSEHLNKAGARGRGGKVALMAADRRKYRALNFAAMAAGNLENVVEKVLKLECCLDERYRAIGIGAVLNSNKSHPPGMLWVTVILGAK